MRGLATGRERVGAAPRRGHARGRELPIPVRPLRHPHAAAPSNRARSLGLRIDRLQAHPQMFPEVQEVLRVFLHTSILS